MEFDSVWESRALEGIFPGELNKYLDSELFPSSQGSLGEFANFIENGNSQGEFVLDQNPSPLPHTQDVDPEVVHSYPMIGEIPAHTNWSGDFSFNVTFDQQIEKPTKSTSWTYSEELDKLFVAPLKSCPFNFSTKSNPPNGSIVRAMPIYSRPEHMSEIVQRCPNHSSPTDLSNKDFIAPTHLVRCDLTAADYVICARSGRLSVVVPYELPQAGTDHTTYLYKFMCYSSCVGGLNRRPIQLIFTLEHEGRILGRRSIKIRICACPGRDKKAEEKQKHRSLSRQNSSTTKMPSSTAPILGKRKTPASEEVFFVPIRGRENYKILSSLAEGLELTSIVTPEQMEAYRSERSKYTEMANRYLESVPNSISHTMRINSQGISPNFMGSQKNAYSSQNTNKKLCITTEDHIAKTHSPLETADFPCSSKSCSTPISSWLQEIGLSAYTDMFHKQGYVLMDHLANITYQDFEPMKIGNAHRILLWEKLAEYRVKPEQPNLNSQVSNSSQSSSSSESGFTSLKAKLNCNKRTYLPLRSKINLKSKPCRSKPCG